MLNELLNPETRRIIDAIGPDNIRFVGGCVRDLIAGRQLKDIDFATTLTPSEIIESFENAGVRYLTTGIQHGSITAIYNNNSYDITSLRKDIKTDGRHAKVQYVDDWEVDAERRDFTLNALYLDANGKLYDYFGGIDHLRGGKVVFIGDPERRIKEDYLRILRYFRFLGIFGKGDPDDMVARTCARHANNLNKLSGERIQSEMRKILTMSNADQVLQNMQNYGILHFIFLTDVDLSVLGNLMRLEQKPEFIRRLAAIKNYSIPELAERWKLSSADHKYLKMAKQDADFSNPKIALRRLGPEKFIDTVLLTAAEGKLNYNVEEMIEFAQNWQIPKFPIVGKDVLALGLTEGKAIGQILVRLEHYWEANNFHYTREDLLKRLKHEVEDHIKRMEKEATREVALRKSIENELKAKTAVENTSKPSEPVFGKQPAEIKPLPNTPGPKPIKPATAPATQDS